VDKQTTTIVFVFVALFYIVPIMISVSIARSRGRSGWVGFWLAAFFGVVGLLACLFLPEGRRYSYSRRRRRGRRRRF